MDTASFAPAQSNPEQPRIFWFVKLLRGLYLTLALLFIGVVFLQVFFAGATLLVDARYLIDHRSLGEAIWPLPILMIAVSLMARLPRRFVLFSILLLVLYVMQYVLIHTLPSLGMPAVFRALHAVNALLMFWTALHLAKSAGRILWLKSRPSAN